MQLLNGKIIAEQIHSSIKDYISHLPRAPGLAVILVGADPASRLYVSLKEKACHEVGINFEKFFFPNSINENELIKKIKELNTRKNINGILIQLPLPWQDTDKIIAAIDPKKDVDGFHSKNLLCLEANKPCLVSPVVLGVMRLIKETHESLLDKKAILVMSEIFARPFRAVLQRAGVTVEVVSSDDPNLRKKIKDRDILITAVGQPNLITGEMVKNGVIIIDIGTSRMDGKVVGDVDRASVEPKAGWLTPVPGGVGPMTVALLLQNVLVASN